MTKEELKNIEKRYLEIGGILIGIVTFLFGSINIFSHQAASPQQLFESAMWLGVILVIFALLLVLVIENWKGKVNKTRVAICGILLGIYTIIICTFVFSSNRTIDNKQNEAQELTETIVEQSSI